VIVADVNLVAYLLLDGPHTGAARHVLELDPNWIAPPLWRIEFLNVLASTIRFKGLSIDEAALKWDHANRIVKTDGMNLRDMDILELSAASKLTVYDCFYVELAKQRSVKLVTAD